MVLFDVSTGLLEDGVLIPGLKLKNLWGKEETTTMRLFPLRSSSRSQREQNSEKKTRAMVYLNVYDLSPINSYLYFFGLGVFHSGIEGLSVIPIVTLL